MKQVQNTWELFKSNPTVYWVSFNGAETKAVKGGVWVAQSVKRVTPDFGSGHDLMVREFEPHFRLRTGSVEPGQDSLSPSLSVSPLLAFSLSQNKKIFFLKKVVKERTWVDCRAESICYQFSSSFGDKFVKDKNWQESPFTPWKDLCASLLFSLIYKIRKRRYTVCQVDRKKLWYCKQ